MTCWTTSAAAAHEPATRNRANWLFGKVAVTYAVRQVMPQATRLVAKLVFDIDPIRAALLG